MKLPVSDVASLFSTARDLGSGGGATSVLACVAPDAPVLLVETLREVLVPTSVLAGVTVVTPASAPGGSLSGYDAVLIVPGDNLDEVAPVATRAIEEGVACALLVESLVEGVGAFARRAGAPAVVAASNPDALLGKLGEWVAESCPRGVDLACAFPFARAAESRRLVRSCASANAAIGLVGLLPGADFPVMAANQMRMAHDLRRVQTGSTDSDLVLPVVAASVLGLASRSVARRALPSAGPLAPVLRSLVAYLGTVACGLAVAAAPARGVGRR